MIGMTRKEYIKTHLASNVCFVVLVLTFASYVNAEQRVGSSAGVKFIVPIEAGKFSKDAILTVRLWNAQQLEVSEKIDECTMTYDMETETERIDCPEGIEYETPMPEEWSFPVQEIVSDLEIRSNAIKAGERYRLRISGISSDLCNTTSADVRRIAHSETIQLRQLSWASTLMGCP